MNEVELVIRNGRKSDVLEIANIDESRIAECARVNASFDLPITGRELGLRVREMREHHGWTQLQLGEMVGRSNKTIAAIEVNQQDHADTMSLGLLLAICNACGFDLTKVIAPKWATPERASWARGKPMERMSTRQLRAELVRQGWM